MLSKPLSHSQIDLFNKCKHWYKLSYIDKVYVTSDTRHLRRGSCVHEIVEWIHNNNPTIEQLKPKFNEIWKEKKLEDFQEVYDETYLMCVNLFNCREKLTSVELKIFDNDLNFVSYLDGVSTTESFIIDYKTSTWYSGKSEYAYKDQMGRYALMFKKKFDKNPKTKVLFIKYFPFKEVIYNFTEEELQNYEQEIKDVTKFIEENRDKNDTWIRCKDIGKECDIFCPYKNMCTDTLTYTLHMIGNFLVIDGDIPELLEKGIKKKFSYELPNAFFIKRRKPMANTTISFWHAKKKMLPLAMLKGIEKTLRDYAEYMKKPIQINYVEKRIFNPDKIDMPDKLIGKELRDYQSEAAKKAVEEKIAVLEIGTGAGKTEIASEVTRQLGYKTLFIVDRIELLKQAKERFEKNLGIKVGMIGYGEDDIQHVTIATIQTLTKNLEKYKDYFKSVRVVFFDECHKTPAFSFIKVSRHLTNTEYRIGLSATAKRDDGHDMGITAVTGYKCFDLGAKELIRNGWLEEPTIIFVKDFMTDKYKRELKAKCDDGLINPEKKYNDYYEQFIMNNEERNKVIEKIVDKHKNDRKLILVKRIDHGLSLEKSLPDSKYLYGELNKKDRDEIFVKFINNEFNTLISTISIMSEGVDLPFLSCIINASGNKGDVKTIQSLGRVLRKKEGKTNCIFYDLVDDIDFFRLASFSRKKALMKEGHNVETISWGEYNENK